jgi:hypothetical protein
MTAPATTPVSTPAGQPSGDAAPAAPPAAPASAASGSSAPADKKPAEAPKPVGSLLGDKPSDGTAPKAEAQPKADDKPKGDEKPKDGSAATVEIKLPEGVKADEKLLGELSAIATKHKLSNEQASGVAAEWIQHMEASKKADHDSWVKQGETWQAEIKAAFGDKLDAKVVAAQKAIDRFGGEELREIFRRYGIGNQPEMLKAWAAVGEAMAEDRSSSGAPGTAPPARVKSRQEVEQEFFSRNS